VKKQVVGFQNIYRDAFNSAFKQHQDEGKAAAIAITACENAGYKKDTAGMWIKAEESAGDELDFGTVQDSARTAQDSRAGKYGIAVKDGGNVTKPGQWSGVSDDEFLDPVNYRYPCHDADHTRAAAAYWGKPANQAQYSSAEKGIINRRLDAKRKKFGIGQVNAESFRKELLYIGSFPHPDDPTKIITITEENLREIAANSKRFLDSGGDIPLTLSHPKNQKEKMTEVVGWLDRIEIDPADGRLYGNLNTNDQATRLIKDDKVRSVSPGILYGVVTANGEFPVLIDHVALTNSPHLLAQSKKFVPVLAEGFSRGAIFFEGNAVNYEPGLSTYQKFVREIKALLARVSTDENIEAESAAEQQKGADMTELEQAKKEIDELKKQNDQSQVSLKKATDDLAALKKEKIDAETARIEAERKARKDTFLARVEKLKKDGKLQPAQALEIVALFEQLSDKKELKLEEGKAVSIEDYLLKGIEQNKSEFEQSKLKGIVKDEAGNLMFDIASIEGRKVLYEKVQAELKERKLGPEMYESIRDELLAAGPSK
jgi:cation transport regulator ChaB/uncharacterized protein YjhX (UPF0386 family)